MKNWNSYISANIISIDDAIVPRNEPCLYKRKVPLLAPDKARLESPLTAATKLKSCNMPLCRRALELVELIESVTELVGVTGGLAYNPTNASDIDIVVYGSRLDDVYRLLVDLRQDGVTTPHRGHGHGWNRADITLHKTIGEQRVLFGYIDGSEYNVKLVPCTRPERCMPVSLLIENLTISGILEQVSPYTIPAVYRLMLREPLRLNDANYSWIYVLSYRLRYTELPSGMKVEVKGVLEESEGIIRIVPDHGGYVKPLY